MRGVDQVEGRVLRVERDSLLVERRRTDRDGAAQLVEGRRAGRAERPWRRAKLIGRGRVAG